LADEAVDVLLTVTVVSSLEVVGGLLAETAAGRAELEGVEEVVGELEVGPDSENLVDEVLSADDVLLAEGGLDDGVVGQGDPLLVDLAKTPLVDELLHGLEVGVPVGEVGLSHPDHVNGGLVQLDEHSVVDLAQPENLKNLAGLGGHTVDTTNAHHEGELVLGGHVEVTLLLGLALEADLLPLHKAVLLDVLLSTLVDVLALLPELLLVDGSLGGLDGALLGNRLPLLEDGLGDGSLTEEIVKKINK